MHRDTVILYSIRVGEACQRLHRALMVDLPVDVLEFDEIWGFIGKKQRRVRPGDPEEFGDAYTFIAMDANRKAIVSYLVAKRTREAALEFARDARRRVAGFPQITTDGFQGYPAAIAAAFGDCDYTMIIKRYGNEDGTEDYRYAHSNRCTSSTKILMSGAPDPSKISTSYVERQNLTMRMAVRRQTRLTNGFSKKLQNHRAAISLYVAHYNFCRVHASLDKRTPALFDKPEQDGEPTPEPGTQLSFFVA